jgi:hypothetical protein
MKIYLMVALAMLGALPALAQDQASCKAYFQVLRAEAKTPGLRAGLDSGQKKWWENRGQKKYPGLCLSGAVMTADKPRYIVIWSKSKKVGAQSSLPPDQAYGQMASALQAIVPTSPETRIYQPRWDKASVTVANIVYGGGLMLPPIYFEADDHVWIVAPSSRKALEEAVKYLSKEPVFWPNPI